MSKSRHRPTKQSELLKRVGFARKEASRTLSGHDDFQTMQDFIEACDRLAEHLTGDATYFHGGGHSTPGPVLPGWEKP